MLPPHIPPPRPPRDPVPPVITDRRWVISRSGDSWAVREFLKFSTTPREWVAAPVRLVADPFQEADAHGVRVDQISDATVEDRPDGVILWPAPSGSGRVVELSIRAAMGRTVAGVVDADIFAMPGQKR